MSDTFKAAAGSTLVVVLFVLLQVLVPVAQIRVLVSP